MQTSTAACEHRRRFSIGIAKGLCRDCGAPATTAARRMPEGKPHLVNGYWLTDSDYELVMGYRRERDRTINAAKDDYAEKLRKLLELVAKS